MYKLVVSDLDGTLLSGNHGASDENIRAIEALKESGIEFSLATGRIYSSARTVMESINVNSPIIACNGAVIYNVAEEKIIDDTPIDKETCKRIIKVLKKADIYFHFYSLETVYGERDEKLIKQYKEWAEESKENNRVKIQVVDKIETVLADASVKVYKFGFYNEDEITKGVFEELSKIPGLELYYSVGTLVDVMNINANKGNAMKTLAKYYGIPLEQVAALGDNENDIQMIRGAGLGIAMGNGLDMVKAEADYITDKNTEDGFAKAIFEKVLLSKNK